MRTEDGPCSILALDAEALGERPLGESERASLLNNPERRRRLDEHKAKQEAFLRRFPNLESLSAAVGESRRSSPLPRLRLRLAIVPVTAAAALAALVLLPKHAPHERPGNEGIKGAASAALDMAVVREGAARAFVGQTVHAGDKLIFRSRVAIDYLAIFSLEASGRVQAIVTDRPDKDDKLHSLAVHLPPNAACPQAIEVDDYSGRERVVAVASASPLSVELIAAWLRTSFAAMPPEARATLPIGPPPFTAQVTTWLLEKDGAP